MMQLYGLVAALGVAGGLAGCAGLNGGPFAGATAGAGGKALSRVAPKQVVASGTDVTIVGPRGFCVDPAASAAREAGSFVLMGNCAAISRMPDAPQPSVPARLTASISAPEEGPAVALMLEELRVFLASEAGRAALSQSGRAADVTVRQSFTRDGVFYVRTSDRTLGSDQWRAFFDVRSRMVSLTVGGTADYPLDGRAGLELMRDFVRRVQQANSDSRRV
ncbi:hypothetical protein BV394_10130 [Brevirhabdus pacifica]|uniref:Uncharacterized protein n=1 Tax=Brevirhabdus pacifica TaxID=1267768 RepID=A0A1U7DJ51_9RHOB|nr:hypothetical protein [Brevirhabdus pacifica]APX90030.1 hypothetical protein BV394_10130 [Brevirhabdus pacifica]PJJ82725.1 hypothetical protein CLV77_2499 [Brevirhabdus pacifica]